jgi:hypothetical protein
MNYYLLGDNDQTQSSWVLYELDPENPGKRATSKLPAVMMQFFGPQPDRNMRMKPAYLPACCKTCRRYDDDDVFDIGFADPVTIRIRGDFGYTQDRVLVISDKLLKALKAARVRGFETKPIGKSGWHALSVTTRVDSKKGVLKPGKPVCRTCGRPNGTVGAFQYVSELSVPDEPNTLFTTKTNFHSRLWDRDIFATEDVVSVLKKARIQGGYCNRLWSEEERKQIAENAKQKVRWKPPETTVLLNGR